MACTTCGHYAAPPNTLCDDCLEAQDPAIVQARTGAAMRTAPQRVTITALDIPMGAMATFFLKATVAAIPAALVASLLGALLLFILRDVSR